MTKDKLGDKLRDKERAEEDRYFAEQDKAKLARMRESEELAVRLGHCPRCGAVLQHEASDGVTIERCPQCHGIWLDAGELEAIVERREEGWFTSWVRSVLARR